jgi:hypothetical protein
MSKKEDSCRIPVFLLCLLLLLASCQSVPATDTSAAPLLSKQFYTATNLRLFQDQYIYWQNRQDGKLLPLGTAVRLLEVTQETAKFIDLKNSVYLLYWQDADAEPKRTFAAQSSRYFQSDDPKLLLEKWGDAEKSAIQNGDIKRGMSQEQIILSWGYPPDIDNPKEQETWLYWLDLWKKCAVRFDNGVVAEIVR